MAKKNEKELEREYGEGLRQASDDARAVRQHDKVLSIWNTIAVGLLILMIAFSAFIIMQGYNNRITASRVSITCELDDIVFTEPYYVGDVGLVILPNNLRCSYSGPMPTG